ncbi:MAG TPA: sugar phosphate isomerase/epimerase family protein [Candidatus Hydrogenedentes bacterium]|jgi:sugar phosphate isomerase/epimerase|nr:sugar phosphate isomerase/epimerase family protein [Candidatus Hydrogenedentota bacterium]
MEKNEEVIMIELGMHADNWRPLSGNFKQAAETAVKYGIEHLEFAAIHGQYFIQAMGYEPGISLQSNPRALKRYCDEKGLRISQIDGSYPLMGPDGSAFGVQYVQQSIRFAAELDCPMVDTVDGAFEIEGFTRDEVFRITCDNYRQVLSWAEDYHIVINVEPHGPYTNDAEFMLNLFKYFDSEWLRCNFDTGNSFIAGHDPLEYLKTLRPYVSHCHIKDVSAGLAAAVRGEETGIACSEVPIGGGVNADNIKKCLAYLKETNWYGVVSLECYGADDNIRQSVEFLRPLV